MTATHGLGTYGNAAGVVTPLDHKMAQLGLIVKTAANTIRAGLFWDGNATIVSGKANMSYDVRAYACVTSRGATAGAVLGGNDAVYNVVTTAAPGSNSRYDVVYHWPREFSIDGSNSNPVIGVIQGTPAASPTVPSLAAFPGAIQLATILVPAGVTATNSGTTITQTGPFTALDGGTVVARTTTERDAYTPASTDIKALCWVIADGIIYKWNGAVWKAWDSDWITYTATLVGFVVGTGGSALQSTRYRYVNGLVEVAWKFIFGTSGQTFPSTPTFSLPVNMAALAHSFMMLPGGGDIFDTSSTRPVESGLITDGVSVSVVRIWYRRLAATDGYDYPISASTLPWVFAAGDVMQGRATFEPA